MVENHEEEPFLSRWINNELTTEELELFKDHAEYQHYQKIKKAAGFLDTSDYDEELALNRIKEKISIEKRPIKTLWPAIAAVAASVVLVFGMLLYNFKNGTTIQANGGHSVSVTLPDGSEMVVNKNSTASFDEEKWEGDRTIKLDGEAYFKVQKGSTFTVETENGIVTVLGTQFNVNAVQNFMEVICYEGKVKVETEEEQFVLTPTQGMHRIGNAATVSFTEETAQPEWMFQKSVFRSIPARYVFVELEKQYQLQLLIDKKVNQELIFTGSFPHNNLIIALQTVFSTLGLKYTLSEDSKTLVVNSQ